MILSFKVASHMRFQYNKRDSEPAIAKSLTNFIGRRWNLINPRFLMQTAVVNVQMN